MTTTVTGKLVDRCTPSELGLCVDCLRDDGTVREGLCIACLRARLDCDTTYRVAEAAWQEALRSLMAARYADATVRRAALKRCSAALRPLR